MTEWTELKDLQAVAKAQADGWEIEFRNIDHGHVCFCEWDGEIWYAFNEYRGRPKADRKVVRVREAVLRHCVFNVTEDGAKDYISGPSWIGWVKGSEWREVEYE